MSTGASHGQACAEGRICLRGIGMGGIGRELDWKKETVWGRGWTWAWDGRACLRLRGLKKGRMDSNLLKKALGDAYSTKNSAGMVLCKDGVDGVGSRLNRGVRWIHIPLHVPSWPTPCGRLHGANVLPLFPIPNKHWHWVAKITLDPGEKVHRHCGGPKPHTGAVLCSWGALKQQFEVRMQVSGSGYSSILFQVSFEVKLTTQGNDAPYAMHHDALETIRNPCSEVILATWQDLNGVWSDTNKTWPGAHTRQLDPNKHPSDCLACGQTVGSWGHWKILAWFGKGWALKGPGQAIGVGCPP